MAVSRRLRRLLAATLGGLLGIAPTTVAIADDSPDLSGFYRQSIGWSTCADAKAPAKARCGTVSVPMDYRHPDGTTLDIAVSRLPATGPGLRLGALAVNFGGPGISGITELDARAKDLAALNRRYDLIGFDPRGVARSAPVDCGDLSEVADPAQLAAACSRHSGWLLPWLGTPNAARDLDVIRQAVGDDRLAYLGFSYGARLGAVYAHEFPDRAGRIVLDGVPDPSLDAVGTALGQARAFQKALTDFAGDCAAHHCPLPGHDAAQVMAAITEGAQQMAGSPLATDTGTLDRAGYLQALQNALYSKDTWPYLRQALGNLRSGDGDLMMQLAYPEEFGSQAVRRAVADWTGAPQGNAETAKLAIDCRDTSERRTPQQVRAYDARFTKASALFGRDIQATLLACTGWPAGDDSTRHVAARGAPQMLMVGTTGDPATPYPGAGDMAKALANNSHVLTYRGEGHGAYFAHSACVRAKVDAYLLEGELPAPHATC
ncbi:TAP-like protein [Streptomyces sp. DvalAA-14]|uniref:alpha/beta hydrolase n=1 Tax=unclassified Streptomyces TaxID=2593676 RepID=UPI00081B83ED|nr:MULTISPECIES: alpha/beta hydrolase [unclassified Streptomyces]MYS24632.1 alpha/beta fold hydrolase [Streptomyces sp. SID4948]SCE47909.1 TAP-like protein [Streptomyces sp. DvalAA-14]